MKLSNFDDVRATIDARTDLQDDITFLAENAFWIDLKIGAYEIKSLRCFEPEDRKAVFNALQAIFVRHLDATTKELIQLGVEVDE